MASTETNRRIPQELDAPMRFLFFSSIEAVLIFCAFFFGVLVDHLIFALMIVSGCIVLMRRFSQYLQGLSVPVLLYWFLNIGSRNLVPSWKRHWRG